MHTIMQHTIMPRFTPHAARHHSSYDGALAALLTARGGQLRELALEAPSRSCGRRAVQWWVVEAMGGVLSCLL